MLSSVELHKPKGVYYMEWLVSILTSKSAQAGIAGGAGAVTSGIVEKLTLKGFISYFLVGFLSGLYIGRSLASHLGVPEDWLEVSYIVGVISFAVIGAIGQIKWIKVIKSFKIKINS